MKRAITFLVLFLAVTSLSFLLAACSTEAATVTPDEDGAPQEDVEVEPDPTPKDETDEEPASSNPGLTAVIVSGESAGAGKPFTFDATQSDPGTLEIVNYQWNMGDGTTLFGISVEHAYEEPGLYTVTLTVVDEEGNTDVMAQVAEIVELTEEPPVSDDEAFTLTGTKWTLDYPLRGTAVTLEFDEDALTGSAGCNTFSARYAAAVIEGDPADITIDAVTLSSANTCTYEIMYQEQGYLDSLASASTIAVDGQSLTLETGGGTLNFSQVEVTR